MTTFDEGDGRQIRLQRAFGAGVREIMVPAVGPEDLETLARVVNASSARIRGLTLHYALGLHPYALAQLESGDEDAHLQRLARILEQDDNPRLRAVGECGLDFGTAGARPSERVRQVDVTRRHLELARRLDRPTILHCVAAHGPMLELLDEAATPPCVVHSFTGNRELVREYTSRGHYLSFSTSVLHPRACRVLESVEAVPADRLLIETDSPDQAPPGAASSINEPANLPLVAERVAQLRRTSVAEIARLTRDNARRVFRIGEAP